MSMEEITIKKAGAGDIDLLFTTCRQSYSENFADHWNEGGLEWYLEEVYGLDKIKSDLENPEINYYIAFLKDAPAGFMKVNLSNTIPGHPAKSAMEIEKIYFRPQFRGKGIGKNLIQLAIELGRLLKKEMIWLGVIDNNLNAIEFYERMGFAFFDKTKLDVPYFKEHLKGMWRMTLKL